MIGLKFTLSARCEAYTDAKYCVLVQLSCTLSLSTYVMLYDITQLYMLYHKALTLYDIYRSVGTVLVNF